MIKQKNKQLWKHLKLSLPWILKILIFLVLGVVIIVFKNINKFWKKLAKSKNHSNSLKIILLGKLMIVSMILKISFKKILII
jgi:predicted MFS family arabinose efflux permease